MNNNALMELPRCPVHDCQLIHRPGRTQEQCYCGTWYDCPEGGCHYSVLFPSAELAQEYRKAELMERLDNLEGCEDNPVYAAEILEIRRELQRIRST